jgi:hypothetical protein
MFFGNIFNLWGYPADEPFLQGEPSDAVKQQYRQYIDEQLYRRRQSYEEALKNYPKEPEETAQKEPNGIIIDGEYEDITNKRLCLGRDND